MKSDRGLLLISFAFFAFLFILSLWFAEERIIFLDNALQTFLLVNSKEIEVMAMRYSATIVRWLPYLGVKLQLGLSVIISLFSISYVFWQFLVAFVAWKWLKDRWFLVAICLSLALVHGHSFFWCNSELLQAIPMAILVLGFVVQLKADGRVRSASLATFFGAVLLAFYHPQSLICFFFGLLYFIPLSWESRKEYALPLIVGAVLLLKTLFIRNWYDTMKFQELKLHFLTYFPNVFRTESWTQFFDIAPTHLVVICTVFLVTLLLLALEKKWYKTFLLFGASLFSLVLFNLANAQTMPVYYAEAGYMMWSGMVAFAFTFDVLKASKFGTIVYGLILFSCLLKILIVSGFYTNRVNEIRELVENYEGRKVIIHTNELPEDEFMLNWGLPFETALYSNVKKDMKSTVIVASTDSLQYSDVLGGDLFINGMGSTFDIKIDSLYFNNMKGPYELLLKE